MKTLLSAVLLIAVSAWGQTPKTQTQTWYHPPCKAGDGRGLGISGEWAPAWQDAKTGEWCIHIQKPHKPKPSVLPMRQLGPGKIHDGVLAGKWPETDPRDGACFGCDGRKGSPPAHIIAPIDPCDGWACTKPVETLPQHECGATPDECWRLRKGIDADTFYRALAGLKAVVPNGDGIQDIGTLGTADCKDPGANEGCGIVNAFQQSVDHEYGAGSGVGWQPDKAAVPVEPKMPNYEEWEADKRGLDNCLNNKGSCEYINISATALASVVGGTDGSKMVKLSDSEYSHLEQLRAAVVGEEKRLAVKYGAIMERQLIHKAGPWCTETCDHDVWRDADHYEYKGQFLLIDKGGK